MNMDSIRKILLQDWDPLGVGDNPNLSDEYDSFIPIIYKMLNSKCTNDQLVALLLSIENDFLGGIIVPDVARRSAQIGAEKLLAQHSPTRMVSQESTFLRNQIRQTAQTILSEKIHPIEGVRRLVSLCFKAGEQENEIFLNLIGIDSSTDSYPLGEFRDKCAPEHLKRMDDEMTEYLPKLKEELFESCREILEYYSDVGY